MGWIATRRYGAATLVATLSAALVGTAIVATPADAADPMDPIYQATLGVTHPDLFCQAWPVWNDDVIEVAPGAGPYGESFRFTTTLSNVHPDRDADDYRIIFTYGHPSDGIAYKVDGSQGPGSALPDGSNGEVNASWWLGGPGDPPQSVGIQLIGRVDDGWELVHTGSVPIDDSCTVPVQQVAGPLEFTLNNGAAVVSGWDARLDIAPRPDIFDYAFGGQTALRWICACSLIFDVSLRLDGEEVWSATSNQPGGMYVPIPPYTEGATATVAITATPHPDDPRSQYWTPVTVESEPAVVQPPAPLVGTLHLYPADPTPVTFPYANTCTPATWMEPGEQLWVSPMTGGWGLEQGSLRCYPYWDLQLDYHGLAPEPVSEVTWYADGEPLSTTGNPLTITDQMCGKVITAKQTWRTPRFLATELTSVATEPVECTLDMTAVTPVITGTPKVGSPLGVDLTGWLPVTATFDYQWHQTTDAAGTTKPISGATGTTFTPTPAQAGFKVFVSVTATADGYRDEQRVSTPVSIPASKPTAPRSLKATAKSKAVALTWSAPSATGGKAITGYRVQRSTNGTSWTTVKTVTTRSYTVTGLTNGKKYFFRVIAVNSVGSSPASATVTAVPATKPSAPRYLKATAKSRAVGLSWSAPSSSGGSAVTAYKVYRSTNGKNYTLAKTVTGRSTTVTGLTKGKKYWFKVIAVNKMGNSPGSNVVAVKPK